MTPFIPPPEDDPSHAVGLRCLATAEPGLRWMRRYDRRHPQLDAARAVDALRRAEAVLRAHPRAGHPFEGHERVREFKITGTASRRSTRWRGERSGSSTSATRGGCGARTRCGRS